MSDPADSILDVGMDRALHVAIEAHAGQLRRGGEIPYVVHPLQVALMLSRLGASSEVVQAGLLHDVVEDCEGWTAERLAAEFGPVVADFVAEVTENKQDSWSERKEHGITCVPKLSEGALLIKGCDKLHNLVSLAVSLETACNTHEIWGRFRGKREGTLDTSRRMVEALCERVPTELAQLLTLAMGRISSH